MYLGFASESKRMISYVPSFGEKRAKKDMDEDARDLSFCYLKRFDAISVCEDYGGDMCRDLFGVQAEQAIDLVLLCDRKVWDGFSSMSQLRFDEEYLLAYILSPMPYKRQAIMETAKNLNKKLVVILDLEVNREARFIPWRLTFDFVWEKVCSNHFC